MSVKSNHVNKKVVYGKVKGYQDIEGRGKVKTYGIACRLKGCLHIGRKEKNLLLLEHVTTSESIIDFLIGLLVNNRVPPEHAQDIVEDFLE